MANHLTPEELSKELGIEREQVIRVCLQEGVPIYQGKIDKTLFQAQLQALTAAPQLERSPPVGRAYARANVYRPTNALRLTSSPPCAGAAWRRRLRPGRGRA